MPIDSWEDLQKTWHAIDDDTVRLRRGIKRSILHSYTLATFNVMALLYIFWEISTITFSQFSVIWLIWFSLIVLGASCFTIWKVYLRITYARGLSLTLNDHMNFMRWRASSRQHLANATLYSTVFFTTVILVAMLIGAVDEGIEAFFTLKRILGFSSLLVIIAVMAGLAFRNKQAARQELSTLSSMQHAELLESSYDGLFDS